MCVCVCVYMCSGSYFVYKQNGILHTRVAVALCVCGWLWSDGLYLDHVRAAERLGLGSNQLGLVVRL